VTLQRWFRWLDERDGIAKYPMVAVSAAVVAAETGRPAEAERWADTVDSWQYDDAPRSDGPVTRAWAAVLRAVMCRRGVEQMRADADEAVRRFAAANAMMPVAVLCQALARILCDDRNGSDALLEDAARAADEVDSHEVQAKTRELSEALQQQTATADVLKVISRSAFDLDAVFEALLTSAVSLVGSRGGTICVRDGDRFRYRAVAEGRDSAIWRYLSEHPPTPGRASVAGRVLLSGRPEIITDSLLDNDLKIPVHALAGSRSVAGVPLLRDDKVEGALLVGRAEAGPFDSRQIELLQTFADQAVIAIENVRLFDELQARTRDLTEALQQQTATADVLKVISRSAFDLQAVLDTLASSAAALCGASNGLIYLQSGDTFEVKAATKDWNPETFRVLSETPHRPGRRTVGARVLLTGEVQNVVDMQADPDYDPAIRSLSASRALLGVPLKRGDATIGAFVLARREAGAYSQRQVQIVQTFADQAVIAIENARLFDEVQAKTRDLEESLQQQTATADVLKVISRSAFDLQAVFDALISSAVSLIGSQHGTIYVRDGDGFRIRAHCGVAPEFVDYLVSHPPKPGLGSASGRVMLTGKVVVIPDILEDKDYTLPANELNRTRSMLAAPLLRNDRVEGVLVIARTEPGAFSSRQIELVETFADQAVIAIENARLFDEVQAKTRDLEEALGQQTATADVLKVISRSAFDLQTVLDTLAASAAALIGANFAVMNLKGGDVIRPEATFGSTPELAAFLAKTPQKPGRKTIAGRVFMSGEVQNIPDVLDDPEYDFGDAPQLGNFRALLGVPLFRDHSVEGSFTLGREQPGAFTQRQIEIVQTFADQAVIAIENVRLFDEVQAKTRDLEESLQQQTATADVLKVISRSAFDLQAVLTTLAESARELCGASFVTLFMRDGDEMRLRAESGCTPEIVAFLRAHPIKAGRDTFTGRVMLSGEAVHLPDVLADPEYDFGDAPRIGNYRTLLGVPLLRDGQVEGVFALARPEPAPFTARQIEMVRAFADQAVIAIENARLFDEVQARTRELAASLDDLRKAQDRLIQSEKLASLGQLTAGIAHEIKNPLNFINNYSALSRELIGELAEAIKGGAVNEAAHTEADELIGAIGGNLDKVVQHGKRADSIVKNMLLHSREGSGERSTTHINAMVEEALNLAYHGARAEKPGFNVTIVKSLDPNAGAADVYAQEMTRVLLNLISNGFYATSKRKQSARDGAYEPMISASTRDLGPKVEIAIRDNGTGIPNEVKAKMFNPFFTTKPAGEGTGLGLSLSHDIVVKQHGGAIEVSTEPDAFTEFTIVLPRGAAGS
ncbi:MAG TPA: GAF domain-containing protein, partial [Roseiarcus sp.]